jgi:hypothetical protein
MHFCQKNNDNLWYLWPGLVQAQMSPQETKSFVFPPAKTDEFSQNFLTINNSELPDTLTKTVSDVIVSKMLVFLCTVLCMACLEN